MSGNEQTGRTVAESVVLQLAIEQAVSSAVRVYLSSNKKRAEIVGAAGPSVAAQKAAAEVLEIYNFNDIRAEVSSCMTLAHVRLCIVKWETYAMVDDEKKKGTKKRIVTNPGDTYVFIIKC
ncbi:hypothetical protein HN358_01990 [Candidatus Uhrbacteria bacterium]|nr:hypothetical protein [Candidatus Uhrbacteria bacterium]MBT7716874.1 hypothetical protein [Candidatus Uhrbacteria bacterium]